jgi:hypothetical protein
MRERNGGGMRFLAFGCDLLCRKVVMPYFVVDRVTVNYCCLVYTCNSFISLQLEMMFKICHLEKDFET